MRATAGGDLTMKAHLWALTVVSAFASVVFAADAQHDTILRNGLIYDGSGQPPYKGEIAIDGDHIAAVGGHVDGHGRTEIDVHGKAIAPGFINMLAHPEESLLEDGRALSDLMQGVTLE